MISIGDEVLAGYTVNTNAALISRSLGAIGLDVTSHRVLSDYHIKEGLQESLSQNDLIITCGGLGPTIDDLTGQALAELFATATSIPNTVGTAPGLLFDKLIALPGVPIELEAMLAKEVIPYLQKTYPARAKQVQTIHIFQKAEVEVDQVLRKHNLKAGIYPHLGLVTVRAPNVDILKKEYPDNFTQAPSLQHAVHTLCIEKGLTLATAESCTGGAIAASLTAIPGASKYFLGSLITYSNEAKQKFFHASLETGAVSQETAIDMATGLLDCFPADLAVAVTGTAGPSGGTPEKPVGTVWTAVIKRGSPPIATCIHARGNRAAIIQRTINHALAEIFNVVNKN